MTFGEKLKAARIESGLKQSELAKKLNTTGNTISNWENNVSKPDLDMLSYICGILHVTASYFLQATLPEDEVSIPELKLIKKYRGLDDTGRNHINTVLTWELERVDSLKRPKNSTIILAEYEASRAPTYAIPYWENGVSAGNGIYQLNDTVSVMMTLWASELTKQADFIIKVSGASMEPEYHDGDRVLVNRKSYVEIGEIGIFVKNGETFIKEMGNGELISTNPDYPNITVQDFDNVVCLGKVIGILKDSMIAKE